MPQLEDGGQRLRGNGVTPAYRGDIMVYRLVVVILGLVLCASVGGALFAEFEGLKDVPQFLVALGSGALGGLGGLLAPSPISK